MTIVPVPFPIYLLLPSGTLIFLVGLYGWLKVRKRENFIFFLLSLTQALWSVGTFLMWRFCGNDKMVVFWDRFLYLPAFFMPPLVYHFSIEFCKIKKQRFLLRVSYLIAIFLGFLSRTDYFVKDVFYYRWGCHTKAQIGHHLYPIFVLFFLSVTINNLLKTWRNEEETPLKRTQSLYILFGFFVFSLAAIELLPPYGIGIYPVFYLSLPVFVLIVTYAITRYRLMGIMVILRRTTVYLTTFLVAISLFLVAFLSFLRFLKFEIPWQVLSFGIFLTSLTVLVFPILLNFFRNLANKYFFASLYESEKVLENLIKKVPTMINLPQLLSLVCRTLKDCFHLSRIGILLYDPETSNYQALVAEGFHPQNGLTLVRNNFLIQYLSENKKPLARQELKPILEATSRAQKNEISAIKKLEFHMKKIEASVCCPLISKNKLIGILILGPKTSKEPYFKEDLEFLENLSYQVSIGLENARLYSEVKSFSTKLKREVKKATEDLQKAYKELKEVDRAKSEFIAMASHQLRTPLTIIKGLVSMILEGSYDHVSKRTEESLKHVFDSNERLIRIVNDLLNISKVELGKMELEQRELQIEKIIDSVFEEVKPEAQKKNLEFIFERPKTSLPKIKIDEAKIRQVIFNLVDNAIKYTKEGIIKVKVGKTDSKIRISVSDTGEGLTEEEKEKIFRAFTRGGAGLAHWVQGAGLGLYLSKKYIDLHKGKIWAESPGKGKGSTFYVELPVR